MTDKQRRSLARYVAGIALSMGLGDWKLNFSWEPSHPGTLASVDCTYGRRIATIEFAHDFLDYTPEAQRCAVIHELIHVQFAAERQTVISLTETLGQAAGEVALQSYRLNHEYGVDAIAEAIAPHYPLWMP